MKKDCYFQLSYLYSNLDTKQLLEGKTVQIEFDGPLRDYYDRLLAYIWVDNQLFNEMLLREGLARYAYEFDPPYRYSDRLLDAEQGAKDEQKAIWSIDGYVSKNGFQTSVSPSNQKETDNDWKTSKHNN
ncbi:thermonuclease family protein [Radiobacillus deserti]|uniref:TNase-like domain-containing protein n=1 Tax=Radiobacillus deserti TaxID=2594883 RepID=A0A516KEY3_9BACI|nr:thermonuclease family protein [Radiobacillus deserti]QDP39972.1 hypothetical protein FN924_07220 [Radiobacillus deserti]